MSSFATTRTFFESVATQLAAVAHNPAAELARFGTYQLEEIYASLRSRLDLNTDATHLVLLIEKPEEAYDDNGADGQWTEHRMGFVLVRQCRDDDFAAQSLAEDEAKAAGRQIAAHIRKLARAREFLTPTATLINRGRFEVEEIGPAFDSCYGVRFVFGWSEAGGLKIDPAAWLS